LFEKVIESFYFLEILEIFKRLSTLDKMKLLGENYPLPLALCPLPFLRNYSEDVFFRE